MYEELVKSLRICGDSVDAIDECCYEECIQHERPIDPLCMKALCNKAADAIEELSKPRWIPVTERLPEEWEAVLVCFKSQGGLAQAVSEKMGNNWSGLCGLKALWWMPLPEPPKEEAP